MSEMFPYSATETHSNSRSMKMKAPYNQGRQPSVVPVEKWVVTFNLTGKGYTTHCPNKVGKPFKALDDQCPSRKCIFPTRQQLNGRGFMDHVTLAGCSSASPNRRWFERLAVNRVGLLT